MASGLREAQRSPGRLLVLPDSLVTILTSRGVGRQSLEVLRAGPLTVGFVSF